MVSQSVTMVSYYLSYKKDLKPHCWDEYFHSSIPKPLRLHSSGYSWDSSGLLSQNLHVKFDKLTVTVGKFLFTDTVPRSSLIGFNPIWPDISIPTIPRGGGRFWPLYLFFLAVPFVSFDNTASKLCINVGLIAKGDLAKWNMKIIQKYWILLKKFRKYPANLKSY